MLKKRNQHARQHPPNRRHRREIRGVAVEEIAEATERNVEMLLAAEKVV